MDMDRPFGEASGLWLRFERVKREGIDSEKDPSYRIAVDHCFHGSLYFAPPILLILIQNTYTHRLLASLFVYLMYFAAIIQTVRRA